MAVSNRTCLECGTLLAPNEMFCSNCGTRYIEPTSTGPASSSPYQIEPTQYVGPSSTAPYGGNPYATTAYGSADQSYSAPPPPNAAYAASPSPYGGQPLPLQPPEPRRRPNIALFIGIG